MRECRKCKEVIPTTIKIDGVRKNISNRKFCLKCSPYKGNNRRRNDPSIDHETSKAIRNYTNWPEDRKRVHRLRTTKKRYTRKLKLVEMAGGACIHCGYNKCLRSLQFHHRKPDDKILELNINTLSAPWETILKEFEKCDLVCANCHGEIEEQLSPVKYKEFDNILDECKKLGIIKGPLEPLKAKQCKFCNLAFIPNRKETKFCSRECKVLDQRNGKEIPSLEELEKKKEKMTIREMASFYDVSSKTVRKWIKDYMKNSSNQSENDSR